VKAKIVIPKLDQVFSELTPFELPRLKFTKNGPRGQSPLPEDAAYRQLQLLSAFIARDGERGRLVLLFFVEGCPDPFAVAAHHIEYSAPVTTREALIAQFRRMVAAVVDRCPRLTLDRSTYEFLEGKPPAAKAEPIGRVAAALAQEIGLSLDEGDDLDETFFDDSAAAAAMTCPKCGYEQPPALECARCGIIVAKYLERKRREEERDQAEASAPPPLPPEPPPLPVGLSSQPPAAPGPEPAAPTADLESATEPVDDPNLSEAYPSPWGGPASAVSPAEPAKDVQEPQDANAEAAPPPWSRDPEDETAAAAPEPASGPAAPRGSARSLTESVAGLGDAFISVDSILKIAFRNTLDHWPSILGIVGPLVFTQVILSFLITFLLGPASILAALLQLALSVFFYCLTLTTLIHFLNRIMTDGSCGLGEAYQEGAQRALGAFVSRLASLVPIILGLICFIVPGVIYMVRYVFIEVVAATEDENRTLTPFTQISRNVMRGYGFSVLAALAAVLLVAMGVAYIPTTLLLLLGSLAGPSGGAVLLNALAILVVAFISGVVAVFLMASALHVMYEELKATQGDAVYEPAAGLDALTRTVLIVDGLIIIIFILGCLRLVM